jgi:hypothetical protein
MYPDQWLELIAVVSVVTLPALAITVRLALKPIVDAILRLNEAMNSPSRSAPRQFSDEARRMEEEFDEIRRRLADLEAAHTFHRQLGEATRAAIGKPADSANPARELNRPGFAE